MLPHEWLETAGGYIKTDALDHHDDHFFPGPQDIAWDLAGFAVEFGAGPVVCSSATSANRAIAISPPGCPFYRAAYLAFRLGYCDMAAQALGDTPDAARFRRARDRYDNLIRSEPWTTKTSRSSA